MLKIFSKEATSFKSLGLGVLRDFYTDPIITEVLNGEYILEFKYKKDGFLYEYLKEENIVVANDQAFRIWEITNDDRVIKVLCKHIFFDLSKNFLEDAYPRYLTSNNALSWMLEKTQYSHNFTVSGDCSLVASARYVRKNVVDAIYNEDNCLLKVFGGELEFDNYKITVHNQRGKNLGLEIRQGKNLNGAELNLDFSTVATRIMPQGKDGLLLEEKYIDSPLISNYFAPLIKKVNLNKINYLN